MRKGVILVLMLVGFLSCKAQSPVLSIDSLGWKNTANAYYKDLNNEMDAFEGTWIYTNGNTSLKIILVKKSLYFNGDYYEDLMIGEYQYIEDGVEEINTLVNLNLDLGYSHKIKGNSVYKDCRFNPSSDCIEGEVRLDLGFIDALTLHIGNLMLHKREINGQEALKVRISLAYGETLQEGETEPSTTMPLQGEFVFFKE